jgi:hypothetical protein
MALVDLLTEDLGELARLRVHVKRQKDDIATLRAQIAETDLGKMLAQWEQDLAVTERQADEYAASVRDDAMMVYEENGNKGAAIGVTVKMFKTMTYDKAAAETWLRANAPALLVVDWKKFESAAVALGAPVTVGEEPRVQIATDLSAYVKE